MNTATPTLEGTAPQWREESLQNSHHYGCGVATDFFINHSIAGGYSYADQAQAFANWQVSHPPFGGHSHNQGAAFAFDFDQWQNQQGVAFAGHYGTPHPQPQLPVIGQLDLGHTTGSDGSIESIVVKLRPKTKSGLRSVVPSGPHLNYRHHHQQQRVMSPSPCPSLPHVGCYGTYVPLLVSVQKLQGDKNLKALIDAKELVLNYSPDYFKDNQVDDNQVKGGASTANQGSPPPPGGEGGGGEEGGGGDGEGDIILPASPKKDLFVFHVPNDMTQADLFTLFSRVGHVRRARIQYHNDDTSKGYGFVTFKRLSDAVVAVHSLNGYPVSHPCYESDISLRCVVDYIYSNTILTTLFLLQVSDKFLAVAYSTRVDSRRHSHSNRPDSPNSPSTNNGVSKLPKENIVDGNRKARRDQRHT